MNSTTGDNVTSTSLNQSTVINIDANSPEPYNTGFLLLCTFVIFTMQTGFGLLESGSVSKKNEVNIMFKNAAEFILGGLLYWLIGYSFAFGDLKGSNSFCGIGHWATTGVRPNTSEEGKLFVNFIFQMSFAAASASIVSGAVAERVRFRSYLIFSTLQTLTYAFASHWVWSTKGWLNKMGAIDIAGSGVVHLSGGTSALVAAWMIGPRSWRYSHGNIPAPIGNGTNIFLGTLFLWWGWIGFNCGSIYGLSAGMWINVAKTAVVTIMGSVGGGVSGIIQSLVHSKGKILGIPYLTNGLLGGLVTVTGAVFVMGNIIFMDYLRIDDPVGAVSVHMVAGFWGVICAGLFTRNNPINNLDHGQVGLFHGESKLFGVQVLTALVLISWNGSLAFIYSVLLEKTIGFRASKEEESIGADLYEHGVVYELENLETSFKQNFPRLNQVAPDSPWSVDQRHGEHRRDQSHTRINIGAFGTRQISHSSIFPIPKALEHH